MFDHFKNTWCIIKLIFCKTTALRIHALEILSRINQKLANASTKTDFQNLLI